MTTRSLVIVGVVALLLALGAMAAAHTGAGGFVHGFLRHLHGG